MEVVIVDPTSNSLPYDASLCEALRGRGVHVVLACSKTSERGLRSETETWDWFYRRAHSPWVVRAGQRARRAARGLEHVPDMYRLTKAIRERRPNVLHFQWIPFPIVDRWFIHNMGRSAPVVLTLHNTTLQRGQFGSAMQHCGYRAAVQRMDAVIVHTQYSKRELLERGWVDEQRIHVIPHGALDYYRGLSTRAPPQRDGRALVLLFGTIARYKGVDVLLRAFAALPQSTREASRLLIAGRKRCDVAELRSLAARLGLSSSVEWDIRFIPEAELADLIRLADVVVFPYRSIDQSGALMAAVAFDKPIVATRVGGFAETLRHGEDGLLVEPGDVEGLSKAIASLLESRAARARMSEAVRRLRERELGWNCIADKTLALYSTLQSQRA